MRKFWGLILVGLCFFTCNVGLTEELSQVSQEGLQKASDLNETAIQLYGHRKFQEAIQIAEQALEIREKLLEPEHIDISQSLNTLALLYETLHQYDRALPLYQRALEIRGKAPSQEYLALTQSLSNLARLYIALDQYDKALPLYQRALAIQEARSPEGIGVGIVLKDLGGLYLLKEQYDKALTLLQRALIIFEKADSDDLSARALNILASLYRKLGLYDAALPLLRRALAIDLKYPLTNESYFRDMENASESLEGLALLYVDYQQPVDALPLQGAACEFKEAIYGVASIDNADCLGNLANLYLTIGMPEKALPLFQRTLAIKEKVLGSEQLSVAISLNGLAATYADINEPNRALPLYQRALAIIENTLGSEYALTASCRYNLAIFHGRQHQSNDALELFRRGLDTTNRVIAKTFSTLTEQQKLDFVKKQEWGYFGLLSLIQAQLPNDEAAVQAGLDAVLSRKGIVFDAQARQQEAIAASLDPETRKLWDELAHQRASYAKLLQNKPDKMTPEDYQSRLKALQDDIAKLEGQIAGKSALVAQEFKQRSVTSKEVAQSLGRDAVLAEFVKTQDYDWDKGKWSDNWRYLAFILKGDGSVKLVDLGDAGELEKSVQPAITALSEIGGSADKQQVASQQLYRLLWQPLASAIGASGKVIVSPDGMLNLVPFAALADQQGRYLIEDRQLSYVTCGRDLTKGDTGIKPEIGLYLAANPRFDLKTAAAQPAESRGLTRSRGFGMQFSPLPGTEQEAKEVPGYLKGKQTIVTGQDATENSVLHAKRPKVMHLATHGFFLQDQIGSAAQDTRGFHRLKQDEPAPLPQNYENPLVRSGLALAGANHASEAPGERDGLLTALEVSGMDLHGTELVTLSACETGRGVVKSGEGVFGLRRAFALAGAKNLIMSLWPVSDAVTAQQMQGLYREYGKGITPAQALRQAQLATIADLRQRKGYASPALWAPFIVQGQ